MSAPHVVADQRVSAPPTTDSVPPTASHTAATRHLCTGVYIDAAFRDRVLRKVHNSPYKRVAPSYAFDLIPLMRNAWYARLLETALHTALVGSFSIPALLGHQTVAALMAGGLLLYWLVWHEVATCRSLVHEHVRHRQAQRDGDTVKQSQLTFKRLQRNRGTSAWDELRGRLRIILPAGVITVVVILGLVAARPDELLLVGQLSLGLAASAMFLGGLRQGLINRFHDPKQLRPHRMTPRERTVDSQQQHPCAVYRRISTRDDEDEMPFFSMYGNESPFVGTGELMHHWDPPMTVRILSEGDEDTASREYRTPPFTAHELVDHLESAVQTLDRDHDDVRLDLDVRRRVYISETAASADRTLLRREPTREEIATIIDDPHGRKHHFLEVTAPAEDGELVTVVLLRVIVQGRMLSIDFAGCALAQTPHEYQRVEAYGEHGVLAVLAGALRTLVTLPAEFGKLWRLVELPALFGLALWAQRDRTLTPRRGVMIGPRLSVRAEQAQEWSKVQLDRTTLLKNMKIIEKRLLNAAEDFLRARNVDTSEFDKQATKIFNSGIMNLGNNNQVNGNILGGLHMNALLSAQQGGDAGQQKGATES
ncbi:hypothetical protein RIF23_16175 [Lipingzhangella sp. LS1_29]|uniref:Uncharacterized protein n=1 Tax=Lipingzhangella rawalii TaxID=2055835 RepID=A0ABU2H964_9ACTN|nr:hypothetical protein [Lipingzhangella rawalii]MDS1271831.1 hypothetical protein [Lipingzhangella rawalii]